MIFGNAGRDGEHDAIAKWHHGLFHVRFGVVAIGNGSSTIKQAAGEELGKKIERYDLMLDAELIAMPFGKGNFTNIVLRSVVKTHRR